MKRTQLLLLLFYVLIINNCLAQNEANVWYFGDNAGVDFGTGTPIAITDGALSTREGCATISDENGDVLFYSEGTTVWNQNHQIMDNGTGLLGDFSSTQSAIIVPKPGSDTLYYIFTVPYANDPNGDLYYSIVDISLNGGLGKVITKNVFLYSPVVEKVTAITHANGEDIWVVTHERNSDAYCSFLITSSGVNATPVVSNSGTSHQSPASNYVGYMKISPMGNYIACAIHGPLELFEMLDFSRSSGMVSNPITFNNYVGAYGLEFSPDESRLYLGIIRNQAEIFQINLNAGTPNDIINSATSIGTSTNYELGALQVGVDQKIYVTLDFHDYLGVINNPNELGVACNFVHNGVSLSGKDGRLGLPSFIQNYFSATITYQNDCFGDTTFFDISASYPIQSITWDFGDPASGSNNTSTDLQPGHVFTALGNYTVTANVVFNGGNSEVFTTDVTIYNSPLIDLGNDTTICSGTTIVLDPGTGYASYLWQDNSTNELFTVSQPGIYWVIVTNSNGCSTTDSITVSQSPPFSINLGNDSIYCYQASVTLHAGNTYSGYIWQDGSTDSILTVFNNGTYWVNVVDVNGCTGGDTIVISFFRNIVDLGNDTTICSGNSVTLDAGIGFVNYLWNTGQTTQSINVNTNGIYNVEASFVHCLSSDTMELTVQQGAFSYAGSNESICQFETFNFLNCNILPNATDYDSLFWFGGLGAFSDPNILRPEYSPLSTELGDIVLSLVAYGSSPCPNDTAFMTLTVNSAPVAGIDVNPSTTTCIGSQLGFVGNSTTQIVDWSWDFGDGSSLGNGQNVNHSYSAPGNYTITLIVINDNSCSDTVSRSIVVNDLPTIDYGYLPNDSLCVNELINFTDNSSPNIISWLWDFNDGNTSNLQNPVHSYLSASTYEVQLIATDNNACSDSLSSALTINPLPEPDFNILPNDSVCAQTVLTFNGFDNAGTTVTDWDWNFGDGNTATGQNITHTYTTPGNYTITLNVLNNNSCTETLIKTVHIYSLPQSNFAISPNDTSCMGELISFDATNATGDIITWNWQFGDGNTAVGQNVSHTYSDFNSQTYNILSIYQNGNGCLDTTIHQRYVQDVSIGFNMVQSPSCQDYTVDFTGTGDLITFTPWNWTYGDGSAQGLGHITSHIYTTPDTVDVILDVCSEQSVQQLIINATCEVDAGSDEATCEDVYFDLTESVIPPTADDFSSVYWYTNGLGSFDNPTLIAPTYFPHLSEGAIQNDTINMTMVGFGIPPCDNDTSTMKLIVIPGAYAQAGSDENSCFGDPYDFANSTDSSFATNYATLYWSTSGTGYFIDSNVEHPIYIPGPGEIGPVTLTMVAANIINCDSIDDMVLTIRPTYEIPIDITVCYYDSVYLQGAWRYTSGIFHDTLPTANYGCDSVIVTNLTVRSKIDKDFSIVMGDSVCFGETANFISSGAANLVSWLWNFGDGNSSTAMNPSHQYNDYGIFTVVYYYTDNNGCSDSSVCQVTVFELPDVAFTVNMTNACVNTQVSFNGTSNSNIVLWEWDFGDGQTGAGQNVNHIYTTWGDMIISLTVTDVNGCSETTNQILVIAQPPIADFTYNYIICDSLHFTDLSTSSAGYNIVTWDWDFDDGGSSDLQNPTHQYPSNTTPGGEVYYVTLTIDADSLGFICTDSVTLPVTVPSLPDIFYTFTPDPTCLGDTTFFFGESGFPIDIWHWDFDDGSFSLGQHTSNLYTNIGIYNVVLSITDTNGCVNTLSNIITVDTIPEVSFTMSDSVICHGNLISFVSTTSINVETWYWDFGDGSFSSDQNPIHYYPTSGSYTVMLTVTDTSGCSNTEIDNILILPGPTADYSYSPLTCNSVVFTDQSTAPTGYSLVEWYWDFDDGFTATVQNPSHSFADGGVAYNVMLIVTADSSGFSCSDTIIQTVITPGLPSVFFTWDPEPTMLGDITSFFGTSGNTIIDWYWDFGDGNFATIQDASHTFATIGTFNVELTVTDIDGCINSVIHTVSVTNVPELDYTWDNSCEGDPVQFTVEDPPTDIPAVVSWSWDFGDGGVSTDMDPTHVYITSSTYNVSLTIIDTMGATNTIIKPITVNPLPSALFSIESPSCEGNPVQFHNHSTTQTGFITEWHWDFGDGNTTTVNFPDNPDVTHIYVSTGTYIVTLTITNSDSCTNSTQNPVTTIPSPMAMFTNSTGCASGPVTFSDTSIENGGGTIITWNWNFDDLASGPENTSTLQNPVHQFSTSGDYDVQLIITNINGCSDTTIATVTVADEPEVDFTYSDACLGSETQFEVDEAVTNVGEVQTWAWSFGDGGTSNLQNPIHTYAATGDYMVTLTITTTDNCTASVTHEVRINPLPNPNFEHTGPACLNDTVYFTDLSSSPNGLITTWHWDFGDGNEITINAPDNPDVTHLYTNDATFAVTLTVTDSDSCEHTIVKQVEIVPSPIADYTFEETCYGDPVIFTDLSTTNQGPDIFTWEWFFGDPNSGIENHSTLQNPTHIFSEPGTYTTTLIIVSTLGCTDTTEQEIIIDPPPEVDFTIVDDSICQGESAEFTGISASEISTWFWDFGDGGYSIEQNPSYTYGASGTYIVTLTVTEIGPDECQSSVSYPIYVNDAPEANFDYENNCLGDSTYFTDLSYSQNGFIAGWEWNFGDGNTSTEEDPIHYYQDNDEYEVTLISIDNYGCSDTIVQWIQVYAKPLPDFSWDQVCEPNGQVNFFDESEPGEDGSPIIGWNWNLDDGYYSTEIDPSYIYPQTDSCYTVILEITDGNGCIATDTNDQVCLHGTLTIDFTSTQECLGTPTFFQATYDPPSDSVASYTWNFNDGSPQQSTYHDTISHEFPNPATYIVELMALDTNGCSTTIYHEVTIDSLPIAQFTNTIGSCDTPTLFTDESLGGGEFIEFWYWDFGDISSGASNTSTDQNPSHLYGPYDSTYQVKLIVTNFNGCIDSIVQEVYVEPCLTADFELPTGLTCARYDLCFVDLSQLSSNNGTISQWRWDFGDGNTYNYGNHQDSICHTYENGGIYEVQMIIVAEIGGTSYSDTVTKQLTVNPTPVAGIIVAASCLGDSTEFYDATNTNNEPLTMWHWDFGDETNPNDTSILQNPKYLYLNYGTYNTELKVMNQFGCRDSITQAIEIYKPPEAAFSFEETCMSYYTYFTDESEGDSSSIEQYYWNFGDTITVGDTSILQDPSYIYDTTGYYTVQLTVIDGHQCYDTITHNVEIYPIPTSGFIIIDTVQQGQIYLDNTSVGSTSYYWDFDFDYGVSSTETDPTHQYEVDGNYEIMLVSYNEYGCPDTTYQIYELLFTNLFVPNAFIPSNSNPELNNFKPIGINLKSYRLEVYSAWGNLVFESTRLEGGSPAEGWDGTFEEEALPTGSFIWRISAVFEDGEHWKGSDNGDGNTSTSGTVTLIR